MDTGQPAGSMDRAVDVPQHPAQITHIDEPGAHASSRPGRDLSRKYEKKISKNICEKRLHGPIEGLQFTSSNTDCLTTN